MPYAFNTRQKAFDYIRPFNNGNPAWTARLNIGKAVGHSQIGLYANGNFVGTLQGDILGSALYKDRNGNGVEGPPIALSWQKVLDGVDEVYNHPTAWGTWFCHDITAAVFRRWGMNGMDVYRRAWGSTPRGRPGLVLARIIGLVLAPGTTAWLGVHEAWNAFQDAWRRIPW